MFSCWYVFIINSIKSYLLFNFKDYIAGGTLKNIIHDLSIPLTWLQRLRYAKDIAAGMVKTFENIYFYYLYLFKGISSFM